MSEQEIGDLLILLILLMHGKVWLYLLSGLIRGDGLFWEWPDKRGTSVSSNHDILHGYNLCVESDDPQIQMSLNKEPGEWVIVVECQLSNFSVISRGGQVTFWWDDDEVNFVWDQQA